MPFKSDASFLKKLAIGTTGAQRVEVYLADHGHNVIELERGSMTPRIWKEIKRKRVRIPDILCLQCGIRIESRAKTKLEITMSHSKSDPKRHWDYGLRPQDWVAFVHCKKVGDGPLDWQAAQDVAIFGVDDLLRTVHLATEREAHEVGSRGIRGTAPVAGKSGDQNWQDSN